MSMFSAEDQARFERQWARAVEAPQHAMAESLVADRWTEATLFGPATDSDADGHDDDEAEDAAD